MNKKLSVVLVSSLLTLSLPASAKSSLWKVSKGNNHLFIGGTIHMLSKSDFPLPVEFEKIYNQSEQLVFETDMTKLQDPATQMKMMKSISYQDGTTLKDHLKPETYKALEAYAAKAGVPMLMINNFKPGMAATMLTVFALQKLGVDSKGVDAFYNDKATQDNKTLGKLETVESQIKFIAGLGEKNPDKFIMYTLRDMKRLPVIFGDMKAAWKTGDIHKLKTLGITPIKSEFPDIYQNLIVKRNNAWIPQIETMMKTKEIEMVLVGALHLAGDDSVLAQLKKLGYTIEQF